MSYDVDDFLQASEEQLRQYDEHRDRFETLADETAGREQELKKKREGALAALASALLPDLSDEAAVAALAQRLGLPELNRERAALFDRLSRNAFRRREIEGSDQYANRDLHRLRSETKRNELEPLYRHAQNEWQNMQSQERFAELIRRGWGTPNYPHRSIFRYFNSEFLNDWRCADAVCETLGVNTFDEARVAYNDRAEQMQVLGRDWDELQREENEIAGLEREREALTTAETTLPQETYARMGENLATILQNGTSPLVDTLPNPDALRSRLREVQGMTAQAEYLDGLRQQVARETAGIAERADKLRSEYQRYEQNTYKYRNKRFGQEQWGKRFGPDRTARYEKSYGRYRRTSDTVYVFHDYNRASGLEDFLWWDVITDGRLDGNFLPEVRDWRDNNPDYRYERWRDRSNSYDSSSSSNTFESDNFGSNSFSDPS